MRASACNEGPAARQTRVGAVLGLLLFFLAAFGLLAAPASADPPAELVGRWESDEAAHDRKEVFWFRKDGTVAWGFVSIRRAACRMEEGNRVATIQADDRSPRVRLEGDQAVVTAPGKTKPVAHLRRHGPPATNPPSLVGVWTSKTSLIGRWSSNPRLGWYHRFDADGRYEARSPSGALPLRTFRSEGGKLVGDAPFLMPVRFTVKDGRLTLHRGFAGTRAYLRVDPPDWYPLEVRPSQPAAKPPPKESVTLRIQPSGLVMLRVSLGGTERELDAEALQIEGKSGPERAKALDAFAALLQNALTRAKTKREPDGYVGILLTVEAEYGVTRAQVVPYIERATRRKPGIYKLDLVSPWSLLYPKRARPPLQRMLVKKRRGPSAEEPSPRPDENPHIRVHFEAAPGKSDTYQLRTGPWAPIALPGGWRGRGAESKERVNAYSGALSQLHKSIRAQHLMRGRRQGTWIAFGGRDEDPEDADAQPEPWLFEVMLDVMRGVKALGISEFDVGRFSPRWVRRPPELPR